MGYPETFEGFQVDGPDSWSTFHKRQYKPQTKGEFDVDIKVHACGVCGSDVHTITGGWGEAPFPLTVGHEIVGEVVNVGPKVTTVKKGTRVGVGAQVCSCMKCDLCKNQNENYCPEQIDTYGAPYPDGTISQGGFASHVRVHEYFVFPIPNAIPTPLAAPMLCAGLTTFSPLKRAGIGPGKTIAVCGIGGLGHYGIMWANALGAEVYAMSHTPGKEQDAKELGAKGFILTTKDGWADPYKYKFDMILNCADATHKFDLATYFSTLKIHGKFWNVGLPDKPLPELKGMDFMPNGAFVGASHIGNRQECLEMLDLAAKKGVKSWVEELQVGEAGCKEAVERLHKNEVRYRFTLTGFDKVFG